MLRLESEWSSLSDYVVMSDTINTFKNRLDAYGNTEIFYFIIVQPTPEPEIRIMFQYVKINECFLKMWT